MVGSRMKSGKKFQTVGRQLKRPDGRKCWTGSEVLRAVDGWRNAGAAECRHRRPERSSPTGMAVRGCSDTGELSLPAWKTPGRGRRASEVRHAVSDPGHGQTPKCRWRHAQQRSTHTPCLHGSFIVIIASFQEGPCTAFKNSNGSSLSIVMNATITGYEFIGFSVNKFPELFNGASSYATLNTPVCVCVIRQRTWACTCVIRTARESAVRRPFSRASRLVAWTTAARPPWHSSGRRSAPGPRWRTTSFTSSTVATRLFTSCQRV